MSAIENLKLFAALFGVNNFDGYALLERVGLADAKRQGIRLFQRNKQRLMIARSLVNRPQIIFMDEPTSGLDPVSSEAIDNIILEERDRGATIFLTTHDMWEADKLCDRVAFMNQGKIEALDSPRNLKQQYGKRSLIAEISSNGDTIVKKEIDMDSPTTAAEVEKLLTTEKVITLHSEEATLEDTFIKVTGRRLTE